MWNIYRDRSRTANEAKSNLVTLRIKYEYGIIPKNLKGKWYLSLRLTPFYQMRCQSLEVRCE